MVRVFHSMDIETSSSSGSEDWMDHADEEIRQAEEREEEERRQKEEEAEKQR